MWCLSLCVHWSSRGGILQLLPRRKWFYLRPRWVITLCKALHYSTFATPCILWRLLFLQSFRVSTYLVHSFKHYFQRHEPWFQYSCLIARIYSLFGIILPPSFSLVELNVCQYFIIVDWDPKLRIRIILAPCAILHEILLSLRTNLLKKNYPGIGRLNISSKKLRTHTKKRNKLKTLSAYYF